jgi:hypothetical protein
MQALAGIALLQLGQVQTGAEVLAFAVDHGGTHRGRQFVSKIWRSAAIRPSLSALRLAGRVRRMIATCDCSPWYLQLDIGEGHGGSGLPLVLDYGYDE